MTKVFLCGRLAPAVDRRRLVSKVLIGSAPRAAEERDEEKLVRALAPPLATLQHFCGRTWQIAHNAFVVFAMGKNADHGLGTRRRRRLLLRRRPLLCSAAAPLGPNFFCRWTAEMDHVRSGGGDLAIGARTHNFNFSFNCSTRYFIKSFNMLTKTSFSTCSEDLQLKKVGANEKFFFGRPHNNATQNRVNRSKNRPPLTMPE